VPAWRASWAGVQFALGEQARLAGGSQLVEARQAEGVAALQLGQRAGVEEGADLFAERLLVAGGQHELAAVPQAIAGQGDLQGAPGALVGVAQRLQQPLAVVEEVPREEADDALDDGRPAFAAQRLARPADQPAERQRTQVGRDPHDGSPAPSAGRRSCSDFE
jgi:hypothetical protein